MPSGKTHDAITLLLAVPTFAAAWGVSKSVPLAIVTTCAMLFGGFMFGPDLDIKSRQYTRWGPFRLIWLPYQMIFRHRSRWSHGMIFGTLIRIIYFAFMVGFIVSAAIYLRAVFIAGGALPDWSDVGRAWQAINASIGLHNFSKSTLWAILAGLWWGAATHTLTDVAWSILRKGSQIF